MKLTLKKIIISLVAILIISFMFASSSLAANTPFKTSDLPSCENIKILPLDYPKEFADQTAFTFLPDSPQSFHAAFINQYVTLNWDADNNADGYYIYRALSSNGNYEKIACVQSNSYIDSAVIEYNTYYYKIAAYTASNEEDIICAMSAYQKVFTGLVTPHIISLKNADLTSIKIVWSPVQNAKFYYVYRSLSENGSYKKIAMIKQTYYTDNSLARHTTYYYKIRACSDGLASSPSYAKCLQTRLATPVVAAERADSHTVSISWNKVSSADGYYLYRADSINGSFIKIASLKTCYYKDSNLNTGCTYYYKLQAYYDGSSEDNSNYGILEGVQMYMPCPANVSAQISASSCVQLSWSAAENANYYYIYRSQSENGPYILAAASQSCSYTDTDLKLGKTYYYKISALKYITDTTYESSKTAPLQVTATLPAPNIAVTFSSSLKQAVISYNAVSEASQYCVYRKTNGGAYSLLTTTNQLTFTDQSGTEGEIYYYSVRACCDVDGSTIFGLYSVGVKTIWSDIDPSKPMIALTFDDGPSRYTYIILDQLEKYNSHATFFVVGSRVSSFSDVINRAESMGCEIGNHTYSHPSLPSLSASNIINQISRTDIAINNVIGHSPKLFRPPYGSYNSTVAVNAKEPLILWSIDTRDWQTLSQSATVSKVISSVKDGDVILMHDLYLPTCRAAEELIPKLKAKGYQLVTVSELAKYKGYTLKAGTAYQRLR